MADKDTLEGKLGQVEDPDARAELRRVYEQERQRTGWAQAAETLGQALARYGAARKGVTGLEMPRTDWERKYDRILSRYSTDLRDLAGREAEQRRLAERQEDIASREKRHKESIESAERIAEQKAEQAAAEKAERERQQQIRASGSAKATEIAGQASRLKELNKQLQKMRDNDKSDPEEMTKVLLENAKLRGDKEAIEKHEKQLSTFNDWIPLNEPGKSDLRDSITEVIRSNSRALEMLDRELGSAKATKEFGLPAARTGERGGGEEERQVSKEDIKMVKGVPYRLGPDGNYHRVK